MLRGFQPTSSNFGYDSSGIKYKTVDMTTAPMSQMTDIKLSNWNPFCHSQESGSLSETNQWRHNLLMRVDKVQGPPSC